MDKFKLLLIGNASHQYIISFVKSLKSSFENISITIISTKSEETNNLENNLYDDYYASLDDSKFISRIKGLRAIFRIWNTYSIIRKSGLAYDAIMIHYAHPWWALICNQIKKRTKNLIIVIWGSDFYRAKNKDQRKLNRMFKFADNIIIDSPQTISDFNSKFWKYINKVRLCYFGCEPIEHIKKIREFPNNRQRSCIALKLPDDKKINVTIGHNGSKAHQHISILKEFSTLNDGIKKKIRIILPMTYGLDSEYLKKIKIACKDINIEYRIFTDFMTEFNVANLRNITDIMINLQTTDTFSGSMREVLYSEGLVINGSWLPYQFLRELGIYYEEVDSIQQLPKKLEEIISNYSNYKMKCKDNPFKIYNISSWNTVIQSWKDVIILQR